MLELSLRKDREGKLHDTAVEEQKFAPAVNRREVMTDSVVVVVVE